MPGLRQSGIELYNWFEQRLGLGTPIVEMTEHEVPENTSSWWYVFGSAATVLLVLQVLTGILLALVYETSASHAWSSLQFLDHNVKLGWFLRAMRTHSRRSPAGSKATANGLEGDEQARSFCGSCACWNDG